MRRFTHHPKVAFSLDLHVLSTPPAFVLSQDQTLQFELGRSRSRQANCSVVRMRPRCAPRRGGPLQRPRIARFGPVTVCADREDPPDRTLFGFQRPNEARGACSELHESKLVGIGRARSTTRPSRRLNLRSNSGDVKGHHARRARANGRP